MISTLLVAGLLLAVAIGTFVWQRVNWRKQQALELPRWEAEFYQRRNRRRGQISGLLAMVGAAMAISPWVVDPLVLGLYWLGILALLVWIILLAAVDASASHAHFDRIRARELAEQAALHRQIAEQAKLAPPEGEFDS